MQVLYICEYQMTLKLDSFAMKSHDKMDERCKSFRLFIIVTRSNNYSHCHRMIAAQ